MLATSFAVFKGDFHTNVNFSDNPVSLRTSLIKLEIDFRIVRDLENLKLLRDPRIGVGSEPMRSTIVLLTMVVLKIVTLKKLSTLDSSAH